MRKKMETPLVYWGYIGIVEEKMETPSFSILGLYWDNGKENGNSCSILGLYWDNEKEHGSSFSILGVHLRRRARDGMGRFREG